jgi:hypothetical protein
MEGLKKTRRLSAQSVLDQQSNPGPSKREAGVPAI